MITEKGFCRDCFATQTHDQKRCNACGSPRTLRHAELSTLAIAHIDCDAFYASVEKRDRPELRDKPLIIGGGKRGVVATACYIARVRGVHSAMPMFKALEACPDAVIVKPNMEKYVAVGHEIRRRMENLTPLVEPISIDEAFLDLRGTEKLHGEPAALTLARFEQTIQRDIGVTVSVGLSYCKFLAKVASDLDKPRGFAIIGQEEALEFLSKQKVSLIWGVGKAFEKSLHRDGIRTIGQLQKMSEVDLMKRYGSIGQRLYYLSRGQDTRSIKPRGGAKSVSSETTFNDNKSSLDVLLPILRRQSERVSERLKAKNIAGRTIVLKLKTSDFKSRTRNRKLPDATQLADKIFSVARDLMTPELDGTAFRLLGVGVADLEDDERADPHNLIDQQSQKRAEIERAMDRVKSKYGADAVETGFTFGMPKKKSNDSAP